MEDIMHPSRGWILIKVNQEEKQTKEGIYLTDTLENEPMNGEVLEIGRPLIKEGGTVLEAPDFDLLDENHKPKTRRKLQIGDTLIFKQHTQHELPSYVGDKIAFVNFESVLGVKFPEENVKKEDKKNES